MVAGMSYFRVRWHRLPQAYRRFVREHRELGGVLVSAECELTWPTTRLGERHVFQFGAFGGATAEEYHAGGPRGAALLSRYGARRRSWTPPAPDGHSPEAEWGFARALLDDLDDVARQGGCELRRLRFDHPERLSTAVADLYRRWYVRRGIAGGRLLGECFLLVQPRLSLRTGSVPYWMAFAAQASHSALRSYLEQTEPYDEIRLMLFSHGVESIGVAGITDWERLADRAHKVGALVGVDRHAYPRDFAGLARAHRELDRIRNRYPMPPPMEMATAAATLREHPGLSWQAP